jgi:beta-mannosidase
MWCGGNELQHAPGRKAGIGIPLDNSHPCMAALKAVVLREDPETRFVPTSASGPSFCADEKDFGKGLHHDVHGPWNVTETLDDWRRYWKNDDSLFRSECGTPSASALDILKTHSGGMPLWPPINDNIYWQHTSSWWLQHERFKDDVKGLSDAQAIEKYVSLSRDLQAQALGIAAQACKDRFPRCGGILIWMGHDCYPCPANTAVIEFGARPKPAYHALKEVYTKPPAL